MPSLGVPPKPQPSERPKSPVAVTTKFFVAQPNLHPPDSTTNIDSRPRIQLDQLGKLIQASLDEYNASATWEEFVDTQRGPPDLTDSVGSLDHPAADLLMHLRGRGAPIPMSTSPWTHRRREQAIARGANKSAQEYSDFVREEFADFVNKQFWTVLPYAAVSHLRDLHLSPLGVVPQRERRPRLIVDLSFYDVNLETLELAPKEAMQFGRALQRILQRIHQSNPEHGPVYISKIDISDGFYRIGLAPHDVPKLGVLLPWHPNEDPMVAFPLTLPMGWVNSPPYFCAATETAADLMNKRLRSDLAPEPHRLEEEALANSEYEPTRRAQPSHHEPHYKKPLAYIDVYVDDFIALLQGTQQDQLRTMRVLLSTLDNVFRPLDTADNPYRQEPASRKKLRKGDAAWTTRKVVLGWLMDTVAGTIELPPHRQQRLHEILDSIHPDQKRASVKRWHRVLGELRSMTLAVPGSRGLFSVLQEALKYDKRGRPTRVRLTRAVHQFLQDFKALALTLQQRPTRIAETLPQTPSALSTTDASGKGMGGIGFINTTRGVRSILWRYRFPAHIVEDLVSFANPSGSITNSDLELTATVVHHDVLTSTCDLREHTLHDWTDNTPAQAWQTKGSTTTTGPAAYLLRLQSHHQREHRYIAFQDFLPGDLNLMADDASRVRVGAAPSQAADDFRRDLRISQEAVRRGVVRGTQQRADRHWQLWEAFCHGIQVDPSLDGTSDPIPFLQVFATRYRRRLGPTGLPVRSQTVSDAVRSVGQTLASMGAGDPRKDNTGSLDFRLLRQFRSYTREDPPPHRVKPIPIPLVQRVVTLSIDGSSKDQAVSDMITLAFFFLLRPGEYTGTTNDDTPFRLQDIQLLIGNHRILLHTATDAQLDAATGISLTFTTQKNGVRGEVVNHGLSGHPFLCPVRAAVRRIKHLRLRGAPPHTILASYYSNHRLCSVKASDITNALKLAAAELGPESGYTAADISARSLRAGGAMALFNSNVDSDTIRLIGRWQSDAMLRYLHLQAQPVMQGFARRMLTGGDYAFHANQDVAPILVPVY